MKDNNLISTEYEKVLSDKFNGKSVLIVEDEFVSGQLISKILKKYIRVVLVETVEACYIKIDEEEYALIFMDINLGHGLSGLDAVKRIRSIEKYKRMPIVATTGFAMGGDKERFIEAGCTEYISKPYSKERMLNLLYEIILEY